MDSNLTEDKTCRICGFADIKNYSLLDKRYRSLYQKILTVYPLVVSGSFPPWNFIPVSMNASF